MPKTGRSCNSHANSNTIAVNAMKIDSKPQAKLNAILRFKGPSSPQKLDDVQSDNSMIA